MKAIDKQMNPKTEQNYKKFKQSVAPKTSGVYFIRCVDSGKFYIGSSLNIKRRIYDHVKFLKKQRYNKSIQQDWDNNYEFEFGILIIADERNMRQLESNIIDINTNNPNIYNKINKREVPIAPLEYTRLLNQGMSKKEIAKQLGLTCNVVSCVLSRAKY